MMDEHCIFCNIVKGEIPSTSIYEDDLFLVILDKFPSSPGHTLIIPKKHFHDVFEMEDGYGARIFPLAKQIAHKMKNALGVDGINILQNNGEAAGQTVFHFHMHLIPRYKNDHLHIKWKTVEASDKALAALQEKMR